ncbi:MAG: amidohydrolase [Gemmatimonadota bacterium]|nr:amidohydrolase [Gemmatimonadota bacterium]MXX33171.1 amidohydrolase [Gemmatimonadota bacterium]MYD12906.1 amidohydrolase [Gemmatimonadota bacterium]
MTSRVCNSCARARWAWVAAAIVVGTALAVAGCADDAADTAAPADLVLRGGVVATVDADNTMAEAVAITDGWIVAVGSDEEVGAFIGDETEVIELDGRFAAPGFIDGHGHYMSLGNSKTILDLNDATNWDAIVAMVAEATAGAEPGEWIRGRGWHQEKWDRPPDPVVEGNPTHATLTEVSPENPVLLGHASGHAAFANALALELGGYDRDSEPPPGGELVRDGNGELTGLLRETAQGPVSAAFADSQLGRTAEEVEAQFRREVMLAAEEALSKGVTSFHDAGSGFGTIDRLKEMEAEGALPVRLYIMVRRQSNDEMDARLSDYYMPSEGDDYLTVRSIKRQIDGALGSHGAWLLEPYEDMPESVGLVLETVEDITGTAHVAIKHGFQVNTHAIGDRANREVLDIYEAVFDSAGAGDDLRWRIEHAQHVHPDDITRFAELGVLASMQGVHATSDAPWIPLRLGDDRARERTYLWRSFMNAGVPINNGTDVPVEDIDPLASFHSSVTRLTADGSIFYPEQNMTRAEALRSYTINNAYAAFEEEFKGSLEVGKLGDVVVIDRNILTVPDGELADARVDMTIVGGVVRYVR